MPKWFGHCNSEIQMGGVMDYIYQSKRFIALAILITMAASPMQGANNVTLHTHLKDVIPTWCTVAERCGELLRIDCHASNDGPEIFVNNVNGKILMNCGGRCLIRDPNDPLDCHACPPPEWNTCLDVNGPAQPIR